VNYENHEKIINWIFASKIYICNKGIHKVGMLGGSARGFRPK